MSRRKRGYSDPVLNELAAAAASSSDINRSNKKHKPSFTADYAEDYTIDGLTKYDMHREPLCCVAVSDQSTISVSARVLNPLITCPVCLGVLRNSRTVMECLHRFCNECIVTSLRLGKKECPQCRIKVSSHRDLRQDQKMDLLIAEILGNVDQYEENTGKVVEHINQSFNRDALRSSFEQGLLRQAEARKKFPLPKPTRRKRAQKARAVEGDNEDDDMDDDDDDGDDTNATASASRRRRDDNVTIRLVPHPQAPATVYRLRRSYITTSGGVRLSHVATFVRKQLMLPSYTQVALSLPTAPSAAAADEEPPTQAAELPLSDMQQTIAAVWREKWKQLDQVMELQYSYTQQAVADPTSEAAATS